MMLKRNFVHGIRMTPEVTRIAPTKLKVPRNLRMKLFRDAVDLSG
jgi:hypothetical protein